MAVVHLCPIAPTLLATSLVALAPRDTMALATPLARISTSVSQTMAIVVPRQRALIPLEAESAGHVLLDSSPPALNALILMSVSTRRTHAITLSHAPTPRARTFVATVPRVTLVSEIRIRADVWMQMSALPA